MREVQDDGTPWRKHLERLVANGRRSESDLYGPPIPEPLEYLWGWLLELDRVRSIGMNGPEPFTPGMVESWARMTGRDVTPQEFDALIELGYAIRWPPKDGD